METTLGKQISFYRKRQKMTQEQLAELLGVTAQAVSKWENDQSCPDITTVPKLASIFSITTDELFGIAQPPVREVIPEKAIPDDQDTHEDFRFSSRKSAIGTAVWVLLAGALALIANLLHWDTDLWSILWPSALLVYGLFTVLPRFSFLSCCSLLLGGFFLVSNLNLLEGLPDRSILLPAFLLLFGLSLLVDALRKPKKNHFSFSINRDNISEESGVDEEKRSFYCKNQFSEYDYTVPLEQTAAGNAQVRFGHTTLDLTQTELTEGCTLNLSCAFGELEVLLPEKYAAVMEKQGAVSSVTTEGQPSAAPDRTVRIHADAHFGEIIVRYVS